MSASEQPRRERPARTAGLLRVTPSPALVVACVALLVALGGTSIAAVDALAPNSVGTAQLKRSAVTAAKIRNGQVTRAKLAAGAVTGAKVADGSLSAADFASDSLPAGPRGERGPQGEQGAAGPPGPGVTTIAGRVTKIGSQLVTTGSGFTVSRDVSNAYTLTFPAGSFPSTPSIVVTPFAGTALVARVSAFFGGGTGANTFVILFSPAESPSSSVESNFYFVAAATRES